MSYPLLLFLHTLSQFHFGLVPDDQACLGLHADLILDMRESVETDLRIGRSQIDINAREKLTHLRHCHLVLPEHYLDFVEQGMTMSAEKMLFLIQNQIFSRVDICPSLERTQANLRLRVLRAQQCSQPHPSHCPEHTR